MIGICAATAKGLIIATQQVNQVIIIITYKQVVVLGSLKELNIFLEHHPESDPDYSDQYIYHGQDHCN